jgi:hypothetical protein
MYPVEKIWFSDERKLAPKRSQITSKGNGTSTLVFWVGDEVLSVEIADEQIAKLIYQARSKKLVITI